MEKLNKLFAIAQRADAVGNVLECVNPHDIIDIAEEFLSLKERAEAAEREAANAKYEWGEAQANYDSSKKTSADLRAKLAELEKQEPDLIKHLEHCSEIVSRWPDWKKKGAEATKFIQSLDEFELGYLNGHAEVCSTRPAPAVSMAELIPEKKSTNIDYDYYPLTKARNEGWNDCVSAIIRNIQESKK